MLKSKTEGVLAETHPIYAYHTCTGNDCKDQFDGCAENPCEDLGTNCTDLTPEEEAQNNGTTRYRCDCPTGYVLDNNNCVGK